MQQITLTLDDGKGTSPVLNPEQIQTLVTAMADAMIAVLESQPGERHEPD